MSVRVLVTNDDGIDAAGLNAILAPLQNLGATISVVAPNRDYSGASASIMGMASMQSTLSFEERELAGLANRKGIALYGSPAECVILSLRGVFGDPPDVVVSGINRGHNIGKAVHHSGTIAAALTAFAQGIPALALSAEFPRTQEMGCEKTSASEPQPNYNTAIHAAMPLLKALIDSVSCKDGKTEATKTEPSQFDFENYVYNFNAPWCETNEVNGLAEVGLSDVSAFVTKPYVDAQTAQVTLNYEPTNRKHPSGSDGAMIAQNYATFSRLLPVHAVSASPSQPKLASGKGSSA